MVRAIKCHVKKYQYQMIFLTVMSRTRFSGVINSDITCGQTQGNRSNLYPVSIEIYICFVRYLSLIFNVKQMFNVLKPYFGLTFRIF